MATSYMEANTYGIGQLITQRKLFRVPEHQRDFAWEVEDVRQFLEDIIGALQRDDPDYFIGLMVLLGPRERTWRILDGQQRLATTTMIYSAIRNWLVTRNYNDDAEQIEREFIGVRQLGGAYSPRLTMNVTNWDIFLEFVVRMSPDEEIMKCMGETSRYSSNYLLMEAVLACRRLVSEFVEQGTSNKDEQAALLFDLSAYLETHVKVVAMDVSTEANAFVIFESLNARGNRLSILDLVKNHVFGHAGSPGLQLVREDWTDMANRIEDKNADDFLKVFWTSRFGRIQKHQLYHRIKSQYAEQEGAIRLASELAVASEYYIALDDSEHEIWSVYGPLCKQRIETLILLGNRQVRAPIMSAIDLFDQEQMESLLWSLIVLTVRYQIVGRRRTGALEIACARMANLIHSGQLKTSEDLWDNIRTIIPTDEEFHSDFLRFADRKASRVTHFLVQLEITARRNKEFEIGDLEQMAHHPEGLHTDFIMPKKPVGDWQNVIQSDPELLEEWLYRLGNRCLLESELSYSGLKLLPFAQKVSHYVKSDFVLTNMIGTEDSKRVRTVLENRQAFLADLAMQTWPLPDMR